MSVPTTLYRLRAADDELLYIGIASNPGRRFEEHAAGRHWWRDVARADLEHHPTREAAVLAERAAIAAEHPRYNRNHRIDPPLVVSAYRDEDAVYHRALGLVYGSICDACPAEGVLLTAADHAENCPRRSAQKAV